MSSKNARNVVNELIVEIFNNILILEEQYHRLNGIELTMNEIHTIEAISKYSNPRMLDIANTLKVTQGTLTTTIGRLEKKGYTERVQDKNDRRVYRLRLLKPSQKVLQVHQQFHDEMVDEIIKRSQNDDELLRAIAALNDFFKKQI